MSAPLREALIADRRLPADCRHMLLVKLGEALKGSPLVVALMGAARAERLLKDACVKASLTLIDGTGAEDHAALVAHLRRARRPDGELHHPRGRAWQGRLLRLGAGRAGRVSRSSACARCLRRAATSRCRRCFRSAGLSEAIHGILIRALKVWREVANGKRVAGAQEVSWLMLKELGGQEAEGDLAALLKSIHLDALRENARGHALAIAAA